MRTSLTQSPHLGVFAVVVWMFFPLLCGAQTQPRIEAAVFSNQVFLTTTLHSSTVLTLESSDQLGDWQPIGLFHDVLWSYPDLRTNMPTRFFRVQTVPRTSKDDWKNQIGFPIEPFRSPIYSQSDMAWVKFIILLNDPTRVYFQDSAAFPFHYDFATQRLAPFNGMDRSTFDSISLYRTNRQAVLGAVLMPALPLLLEYGVQFVGLDPFTPEEIARWYDLVKATVYSSNGAGVFYVPTFEQIDAVRTNKAAFDVLGVPVAAVDRWISGNNTYAPGWALGTLKFFPAAEISAAYAEGRLRPEDILLTDGVPAETPLVAGIISLRPSTPNSHTAILAKTLGIPFVYFSDSDEQARLQSLAGRKVVLRAMLGVRGNPELAVFDVEGSLTPEVQAELLALKKLAPIRYTPKQRYGSFSQSTDTLSPADIQYFGGKAANYGFLRRHVPTNSPPAIAFSFDLWDEFMSQTLPGGTRTLGQEVSARLAPFTNYPPDMLALKQALAQIRSLITQSASFNGAQQQAITNALVVFHPSRKIRFRSSTNVEDSEAFTGAGLYDSYSGCLLDDLD
ncbi:MAG TPA: hypothetical protein VEC99_09210, partial [Clostridia bacterium]|nr:hypothetical protein [Clostridia bacterium]